MKRLLPIPDRILHQLKLTKETGLGYLVVSLELKDGRSFDQIAISEGCIIEVRGFKEVPFATDDMETARVTHQLRNFREASDVRSRNKTLEPQHSPRQDFSSECLTPHLIVETTARHHRLP